MHVISKRPFSNAGNKYPNNRNAIMDVYNTLRKGVFETPEKLKNAFPSLDNFKHKDRWWVFDIGGNNLRLVAAIQFAHQRLYVKSILTHAEYDKFCKKYIKGGR